VRGEPPDLLVGEIERERRERRVLVIAAAFGIIAGAVLGMVFILGAIGDPTPHARGLFRHGAVGLVIGPPIVSIAIGYLIYGMRRRRRPR
jgi:hypothetical protein